jgi:putative tryptophan/tyrosine transport system substrate-binding protein
MKRREFVMAFGGAALWPLCARAQPPARMPRIGILCHAGSEEEEKNLLDAIRQGLRDVGYEEGRNIKLELRFPAEELERFNALAAELVALQVDILVAVSLRGARAAQRATATIPVVFLAVPDPVGSNIVDSLDKPGKNITGLSTMAVELTPKRLQLLKDAVVGLSRVGLLVNATDTEGTRHYINAARTVADPLGISMVPVEVSTSDEFERAFSEMNEKHLQAVVLGQDGLFFSDMASAERLGQLAIKHNIPMMAYRGELAEAGAFMSYGPNNPASFRRVGIFIDKILKGAKPADLPVEQPTTFEFFINMKTGKALGLSVPYSLLAIADRVFD